MAQFSVQGMRISGIAAAVPSASESNYDYSRITEQERAMLVKTTGVEIRHLAPPGMATSDLCQAAAEKILAELNWERSEIDLLVFVSQSPDYFLPATAIVLQGKLGLPKSTAAFDMSLGCSGYVYGLSVVATMMSSGGFRKALLLAGDISSSGVTPTDKSTWPLFGDAGTATAIEYDPEAKSWFNLQSDGTGYEAIIIPDGGLRNPLNDKTFITEEPEPGIVRHRRNLWLNGLDVFNFSVREAPPNVSAVMNFAGTDVEHTDFFVFHQANRLMLETIRKKLKVPPEKTAYSLGKFGNTSSASIPLTIVSELQKEALEPQSWVFSGFGVGLSWASVCLSTSKIVCPEVIYL